MHTPDSMIEYYARRAAEYEQIYQKPERQQDLARLRQVIVEKLTGHTVLEIACGTGYWTQPISLAATSVLATDINEDTLAIARAKAYEHENVHIVREDAYSLSGVTGEFSAGFGGFWWSHVPRQRYIEFLQIFHARLAVGAVVLLCDNTFVPGSSTPMSRLDNAGNSIQQRRLSDGRTYEVIKNYPTEEELVRLTAPFGVDQKFIPLTYYWVFSYVIRR